ncbi:acetyltransferase [Amylibacter marinus]|uniref:Acetyltransferase n=1 Tax=Amylibacter marinus TaxID=1475483 RepID=A0ABQ5VUI8_9RHOB|nr:GNAT family protein [Amylibacter marinus]GLQ34930.1 acetyltransferase [Amylibacter marinus]
MTDHPLANWTPPPAPDAQTLTGQYVQLERLCADQHGADLHSANSSDPQHWFYLPYGPFPSLAGYHRWIKETAAEDPYFYAIRDLSTQLPAGVAAFMRIKLSAGSIQVGHVNFTPALQRKVGATEAIYLMMKWAFESGYRRFEWKCDAANIPSRRAAQRLGFSYEGLFRQASVVKGRNRDTAWFACIDAEWPALQSAYQTWLSPRNFDAHGQQIERLGDLTQLVRAANDPEL